MVYSYRGKTISKEQYRALIIAKDAQLLVRNNRVAEAITRLEQALALDPTLAEAEINLGNLLVRQGRLPEAIKSLRHAVSGQGGHLEEAWINLAGAQASAGQSADAEKTYTVFLQKFPNSKYRTKIIETVGALQREQSNASKARENSQGPETATVTDYYNEAILGHRIRWQPDQMPVRVFIADGTGKHGYQPQFRALLKDAFAKWQAASEDRVTFQFVDSAPNALITCTWVDDPKVLKSTIKKGDTKLSSLSGALIKANIRLLLGTGGMNDPLMQFTALHEIGHAIGLQGHSPNPNDVMFFSANAGHRNHGLTPRDINTVRKVYAADLFANNVTADHDTGVAELEAKNYAKAMEAFLRVLKARPDMESARVNVGLCYAGLALQCDQAKDFTNAEHYYTEALKIRKLLAQPQLLNSAVQNFAAMLRDRDRNAEADELDKQLK
ncbi:MAG: tetratricopeptide repeat protein [Candidatus Obscuribacterales bacterium]|nr:tetratricopeptide repeat protein [Candidatus Obscuribacterales bacterium]